MDSCYLDFETRSLVDLKKIGAHNYAVHPSTEPLCLAYAFGDLRPVHLWTPGFEDRSNVQGGRRKHADIRLAPRPTPLFQAIFNGALLEAHNAEFERAVWAAIMVPRFGWPEVPFRQWRCSMAKARAFSLPAGLEKVCAALGLAQQKDMVGARVLKKIHKRRNPTKADPAYPWHQRRADLLAVMRYCVQDVRAARTLSMTLRDLSPEEQEVWFLDQEINDRGVQIDLELAEAAVALSKKAEQALWAQLAETTGGAVKKTTERRQMIEWLRSRGVTPPIKVNASQEEIETTESKSLRKLIRRGEIADLVALAAVETWLAASRTSAKKYTAMVARAGQDGRIRGHLVYCGADRTGRFSSRGVQTQNMVRPSEGLESIDELCGDILTRDYELLATLYGPERIPEVLGIAARGALVASQGRVLQAPDFSAVEARGAAWIARDEPLLEAFRKIDSVPGSPDIYCWQASRLLGRTVTKKDKHDRQTWGKVPILGCQYSMSAAKLQTFAADMGVEMPEKTAVAAVRLWRADHPAIVNCWYATERAAIAAVRKAALTDRLVVQDRLRWKMVGRFLHCRLPSGRRLSYLDPKLQWVRIKLKDGTESEPKLALTYTGTDTYTRKWGRVSTYGGKLFENIVQALCRDLLTESMMRLKAAGYNIVLHAHDEIVVDRLEASGAREQVDNLVETLPSWADGFPLVATSEWTGRRYRK